jgi:hypothetical protein
MLVVTIFAMKRRYETYEVEGRQKINIGYKSIQDSKRGVGRE